MPSGTLSITRPNSLVPCHKVLVLCHWHMTRQERTPTTTTSPKLMLRHQQTYKNSPSRNNGGLFGYQFFKLIWALKQMSTTDRTRKLSTTWLNDGRCLTLVSLNCLINHCMLLHSPLSFCWEHGTIESCYNAVRFHPNTQNRHQGDISI